MANIYFYRDRRGDNPLAGTTDQLYWSYQSSTNDITLDSNGDSVVSNVVNGLGYYGAGDHGSTVSGWTYAYRGTSGAGNAVDAVNNSDDIYFEYVA